MTSPRVLRTSRIGARPASCTGLPGATPSPVRSSATCADRLRRLGAPGRRSPCGWSSLRPGCLPEVSLGVWLSVWSGGQETSFMNAALPAQPPFARRGGCGQRRRVECHRHRLCPAPRAAGVASPAAAACSPLHQVWPTVRGLETQRPLFHMCARPQPLVMTPDVLLFLTERNDRPDVPLRALRPPRPRGSARGHSDTSASSLERGPCFLAQGLVTSQPSDSDVRGARPPCGHTARTLTRIREDPPLPSSAHALAPGAGAWPEPLPPRTSAPHGLSLRAPAVQPGRGQPAGSSQGEDPAPARPSSSGHCHERYDVPGPCPPASSLSASGPQLLQNAGSPVGLRTLCLLHPGSPGAPLDHPEIKGGSSLP